MPRLHTLLDALAGRLERMDRLDGVAATLVDAGQKLRPPGPVTDVLSGVPAGHPAHPVLVTVPLGAWTSTTVLDIVGESTAARRTAGFGVLAALPAVATGFSDWMETDGAERRVGLVHAAVNDVGLVLQAASWWVRGRDRHALGVALSALGLAAVTVGGWLGGHLTYALGVGVDTTAFQKLPDDWTDVGALDELPEGTPVFVAAGDAPLVALRRGTRVSVLTDRCTHRGAPLHEGTLVDGCLECPWHGSRFDADTGAVVRGPATRPQVALQTRVRDGRVEVRQGDEPRTLRMNPVTAH